jgi:hypothetical protein
VSRARLREAVLAALVFLFATVLFTWPLAARVSDGLGDVWDAKFNAWILHWDFHQTLRDPLHLFDANIFHPARYALAFSENLYGAALFGFLPLAAGASTLATYNVLFLLGMFLSAMAAWALSVHVTGDASASLLAGVVYAFVPWRLAQVTHLQYQWGAFLALLILFLLKYLDSGRRRDLALFALFFAWNAVTNVHYAVFSAVAVCVLLGYEWLASGTPVFGRVAAGVGAALAAAVLVLPFYVPYAKASRLYGMSRGLDEIEAFSGRPIDFLTAGPQNKLYAPLTQKLGQAEGDFFPGLAVAALATAALMRGRKGIPSGRPEVSEGRRRAARALDVLAAAGLALWVCLKLASWDHLGPVRLRDPGRILVFVTIVCFARLILSFPARSRFADLSDLLRRGSIGPRRGLLLAIAAAGVVVALGTHTPYYRFLVDSFGMIFHALRVPSRGIVLFQLALGVLAAWGLSLLRRGRRWPIAAALAVTAFEYRAFPLDVSYVERDPHAVYRWLAGVAVPGSVVEWPIGTDAEIEYVFRSTAHWKPLVNGYSGFAPPAYRELVSLFTRKPIPDDVWRRLREADACLLILHPKDLPDESRAQHIRLLATAISEGRAEPVKTFANRDSSDLVFRLAGCSSFDTRVPAAERDTARRQTELAFRDLEDALNPPFGVIDSPRERETVSSGAWGYGWALDDSGVADVRVSVDGVVATHPLIHQPHPGVREVHPGYPESDSSGFGFALPVLPPGPHTLTVTIVARDGGKTNLTREFVVR